MEILKQHRFERNPIEQSFVEKFIKEYGGSNDMDLIVFSHPSDSITPKDFLSYREKSIVLSTIQWLGSPVGQSFLNQCGFIQNTTIISEIEQNILEHKKQAE